MRLLQLNTMARSKEDQGSKQNFKDGFSTFENLLYINTDSSLSALQNDLQKRCSISKNPGKSNNNKTTEFSSEIIFFFFFCTHIA